MNPIARTLFLLTLAVAAFLPQTSFAGFWEGDRHSRHYDRRYDYHRSHYYHHYPRYPYGGITVSLPNGYINVGYGGRRYYYGSGVFYQAGIRDYVVVPAPVGAVVTVIPRDAYAVVVDGVQYHTYNGIYYKRFAEGYKVVDPPAQVIVEPTTIAANVTPKQQEEFTLNIPNNKGGYTAVSLKRSGEGFIGPQGEFYNQFPTVEQLKTMYAKS
jgi:hypothetical protein